MNPGKRRSGRILLTFPLQVSWTDGSGREFKGEGRTITINRHGASVQFAHSVRSGQIIRILNLASGKEANFRVVGPVAPVTDHGGKWGVEYVDPNENIWGVQFPPLAEGQNAEFGALLECAKCHTAVVLPVSLVEVEVLDTAGIIIRSCGHCQTTSTWSYADKDPVFSIYSLDEMMPSEARGQSLSKGRSDKRQHRSVALQVPVSIRDFYGSVEIAKSGNVSKGGFCFASEKEYLLGQGILVVCPYDPRSSNTETRARIVRRQEAQGTYRKVYAVKYVSTCEA